MPRSFNIVSSSNFLSHGNLESLSFLSHLASGIDFSEGIQALFLRTGELHRNFRSRAIKLRIGMIIAMWNGNESRGKLMKNKVLLFIVMTLSLTFSHQQVEGAVSKSTSCIFLFNHLKKNVSSLADKDSLYTTLSELPEDIRQGGANLTPNVNEGFVSSEQNLTDSQRIQAAGRLNGIREFMHTTGNEGSSEQRFMFHLTLHGSEQINDFFMYQSLNAERATFNSQIFVKMARVTGAVIAGCCFFHNYSGEHAFNPYVQAAAIWALLDVVVPSFYDNGLIIEKQYAALLKIGNLNGWRFLSQNFLINKQVVKDLFSDYQGAYSLNYISQRLGRVVKKVGNWGAKRPEDKLIYSLEKSWMGADFILKTIQDGSPELHVIIRGTSEAPPFPKFSPEKQTWAERIKALVPGFPPRPRPAPVPGPNPGIQPIPQPMKF